MTITYRYHFRLLAAGRRAGVMIVLIAGLGFGSAAPLGAVSRAPEGEKHKAEVAYYTGNFAQAETEYRRYLAGHGEDTDAVLDLASVLVEDGRAAEAARLLEQRGCHGFELGVAYLAAGDYKKANLEFVTFLRNPGPQWRTRMLLGLLSALQGLHGDAVEYYWQALNEEARQPTVHLLLARSLAALGEDSPNAREYFRQRAREEYLRALKTDPSLWQVHGDLAKLNEDEGRYRQALQEWVRVRDVIGRTPLVEEAVARVSKLAAAAPSATPTTTPAAAPESARTAERREPSPARRPAAVFLRDIRVRSLAHPDDPIIRVGLGDSLSVLSFGCAGNWVAKEKDGQGRHFWEGVGGHGYRLVLDKRGRWVLKSWEGKFFKRLTKPIVIAPINSAQVMGVMSLYQSSGYFWGGRLARHALLPRAATGRSQGQAAATDQFGAAGGLSGRGLARGDAGALAARGIEGPGRGGSVGHVVAALHARPPGLRRV